MTLKQFQASKLKEFKRCLVALKTQTKTSNFIELGKKYKVFLSSLNIKNENILTKRYEEECLEHQNELQKVRISKFMFIVSEERVILSSNFHPHLFVGKNVKEAHKIIALFSNKDCCDWCGEIFKDGKMPNTLCEMENFTAVTHDVCEISND